MKTLTHIRIGLLVLEAPYAADDVRERCLLFVSAAVFAKTALIEAKKTINN
jgi:hypothetical protein